HHRPVRVPFSAAIEDATQRQQVNEVGQVRELKKIISERRRKLLEPLRRVNTKQRMVESDELGVLPARIHHMNQIGQLLKAEEEEQVRIPVSPEVPKTPGKRGWLWELAPLGSCRYAAHQ